MSHKQSETQWTHGGRCLLSLTSAPVSVCPCCHERGISTSQSPLLTESMAPLSPPSLICPQLLLRPNLTPGGSRFHPLSLHFLVYIITAARATVNQHVSFSSGPQHLCSSVRLQSSWTMLPGAVISWCLSPAWGSSFSWPRLALNFRSTFPAVCWLFYEDVPWVFNLFFLNWSCHLNCFRPSLHPCLLPSSIQISTNHTKSCLTVCVELSDLSASSFSRIPKFNRPRDHVDSLTKCPECITALIFIPLHSSSCHFSCTSALNFPIYYSQCLKNHLPKWYILPCHLPKTFCPSHPVKPKNS